MSKRERESHACRMIHALVFMQKHVITTPLLQVFFLRTMSGQIHVHPPTTMLADHPVPPAFTPPPTHSAHSRLPHGAEAHRHGHMVLPGGIHALVLHLADHAGPRVRTSRKGIWGAAAVAESSTRLNSPCQTMLSPQNNTRAKANVEKDVWAREAGAGVLSTLRPPTRAPHKFAWPSRERKCSA